MPFDGIVARAVTNTLRDELIGGKVNKIYQPAANEIIINIRNQNRNHSLLISVHPNYARIHLTEEKRLNPKEPPMFCMVLRKHLQGAIINDIVQEDLDRIISIQLTSMNEIGDLAEKTIRTEIMGRHSNLILINNENNKIIDCIKHIPPFQNRYRTLLPGATYTLPPKQDKINLLTSDVEEVVNKLDFNAGRMDQQLIQHIAGISKTISKEIVHQAHLGSQAIYTEKIGQLQDSIVNNRYEPAIYSGVKEDFHAIALTHLEVEKQFDSVHEMLDGFYRNKAERDRVNQQMKDLIRLLNNEINKNKRKLGIHENTLTKAGKRDDFKKLGELLTANLHLVKKGDKEIAVTDYYDPEQAAITIPLSETKTPSENAQQFFKKYRKLDAARSMAKKEILKTNHELRYLEDVLMQIDQARDEDIQDIRAELQEEGYLKKQKTKKKKAQKPKPERFTATDGTEIYVGRNNKQNEYVTHKLANRNDIWLHTLDIPGSHVIIKSSDPSEETLREAAEIAAHYSKAKGSASVPVDYTLVKYVKKPAGAKPGFVIYTDQKTLYVTPDEKAIEQLRGTNN